MAAGIVTEMNIIAEIDVAMAMDAASRRRLLFAVIVNEQNEVHRSITVNILHGIPQGTSLTKYLVEIIWTNRLQWASDWSFSDTYSDFAVHCQYSAWFFV